MTYNHLGSSREGAGPPQAGQPQAGHPQAGHPQAGHPQAGQLQAGQPQAEEFLYEEPPPGEAPSGDSLPEEPLFVEYRPNRRRWRAVLAVLAAAVLLVGGVYAVRWTFFSPDAAVEAHFRALANRDLAAALESTTPEAYDPDSELLDPAIVVSEDYLPPTDLEIVEVTTGERTAEVQVAFTIGEERYATSLALRRREDTFRERVFHRWEITDAIRPARLGSMPESVTVNGVPVTTRGVNETAEIYALMGGYRVGTAADDPLWEPQTARLVVGPVEVAPVELPFQPRDGVVAEVDRQLQVILADCATRTELAPAGCPFSETGIVLADNVAWRISVFPEWSLVDGPDELYGVAMRLRTDQEGEAVVTGIQAAQSQPFERVVPFRVTGEVTAEAGQIVLTLDA